TSLSHSTMHSFPTRRSSDLSPGLVPPQLGVCTVTPQQLRINKPAIGLLVLLPKGSGRTRSIRSAICSRLFSSLMLQMPGRSLWGHTSIRNPSVAELMEPTVWLRPYTPPKRYNELL